MRSPSQTKLMKCIDCGLEVDVHREHGYESAAGWALCLLCALNRGARFDEEEGRLVALPEVDDLPRMNEHEVR